MMNYKGYTGVITTLDETQGIIHGKVDGIIDVVTFQGKTSEELLQAFHDSVDDYLDFCQQRSEPPDKPHSGKLLVSMNPSLHARASFVARKAGKSLNSLVLDAIMDLLYRAMASQPPRRPPQQPQGSGK